MIDNFPEFAQITNRSFQKICANPMVLVTAVNADDLYATYLASFPEGTNPVYRERTEHDCSCCKQFIRRAGNVVEVRKDGTIHTIWEDAMKSAAHPYDVVAAKMDEAVRKAAIEDLYRVGASEASFGSQQTRTMDDGGRAITWKHFFTGEIPKTLRSATPDKQRGDYRTTTEVFERGLKELGMAEIDTIISLAEDNNLYRGQEHLAALRAFREAKASYQKCKTSAQRQAFVWTNATGPASRFRNTAIGTLAQDLSEGRDIEAAVGSFEAKVAPENYKRTKSLITPAMVKKAMQTIEELGLEPALERRFAKMEDISVRDVLWVNSAAKPLMKGGIGDVLMRQAVAQNPVEIDESRAEQITMEDFMLHELPKATEVSVRFSGRHVGNLMSLTAPVHPEAKQLFPWSNDFAWSYGGNLTDSSLRQAVQSRGGRVDGVFRFSHSWNHDKRNASLMDLHVFMPGSGIVYTKPGTINESYGSYARVGWNNRTHQASGGVQDVDYTLAAPPGYVPVENITFPDIKRMPEGKYICKIHNWSLRPPTEGGFKAEIEFGGQIFSYDYAQPLKNKEWVTVATVTLHNGRFSIEHHIPHGTSSQEKWGLNTETFVKVNAVTLSPNFWGDNQVGNRHTFFVLDGARNDEPTRGIYNEFLHPRLQEHRKVFEVIGDKTKCQPTDGQLSGLGFSSTKKDSVLVKVTQGKKQRLFNVSTGAKAQQQEEEEDGHQQHV
jgi:hypothetical protein